MKKTIELSLGLMLSFSMIHENIEKLTGEEREALFQQISDLTGHAARKMSQRPWPPRPLVAARA